MVVHRHQEQRKGSVKPSLGDSRKYRLQMKPESRQSGKTFQNGSAAEMTTGLDMDDLPIRLRRKEKPKRRADGHLNPLEVFFFTVMNTK